jgi:dCTP deaminase
LFPRLAREGDESTHPGSGILPYQTIAAMIRSHVITAVPDIVNDQTQPASLDLRLGRYAYRVRASFLPGQDAAVMTKIEQMDGLPPLDLQGGAVLEKKGAFMSSL